MDFTTMLSGDPILIDGATSPLGTAPFHPCFCLFLRVWMLIRSKEPTYCSKMHFHSSSALDSQTGNSNMSGFR